MQRVMIGLALALVLNSVASAQIAPSPLYFPQVVIGGGVTEADGNVINGWEFVLRQMNKTELPQIAKTTFRLFNAGGTFPSYQIFRFYGAKF